MEDFNNLTINIHHVSDDVVELEEDVKKNEIDISSINITVVSMNERIENKSIKFNKRISILII